MIHVAYCFDENYQQHFGAAVTSLLCNSNQNNENLVIHAVTDKADKNFLHKIEKLRSTFRAEIEVYPIQSLDLKLMASMPRAHRMPHFSKASYYRLLLPEIIPPTLRRLIYLDSDTIVLSSVKKLWETQVEGFAVAAAPGVVDNFNTGVLLINLDIWRDRKIGVSCMNWAQKNPEKAMLADQSALNAILHDSVLMLEGSWNSFVRINGGVQLQKNPSIIHFITHHKPWQSWYHNDLGKYYWRYLDISPWQGAVPEKPETIVQAQLLAELMQKQGKQLEAIKIYNQIIQSIKKS